MSARAPSRSRPALVAPLLELGGLWLLIVLAGVLLVAGLLGHWRNQQLQSLERAQLELTLRDIQETLEDYLSRDMELPQNAGIQRLLESRLEQDAQLYSLEVLDRDGRALFSTDRGTIGEPLPAGAQAAADRGARQHQPWHAQIAGTPVIGIALRGPIAGETAGHVSATYAAHAAQSWADPALIPHLLLALCATALGGIAAVWWVARSQRQLLDAQAQGRWGQIHAQLAATARRLDDASIRLDAVERIE